VGCKDGRAAEGAARTHTDYVTSVAFSPDGNRIVSGSDDKSVRVWDAKTGEQLRELQGHTDSVTSVAFSPDGNRIVSGSDDKSVRVWDAKTGEQLRELQGHTD
jgi:WD40 repeat protein